MPDSPGRLPYPPGRLPDSAVADNRRMPSPETTTVPRTTTTPLEALVVVVLCFGWALWSAITLAGGRTAPGGFTDGTLLAMACFELVVAAVAIAFLRWRGYAVRSLVPVPTWRDSALGLGVYVACWMASVLVLAPFAADFRAQPISHMMADSRVTLPAIVVFSLVNGAYEEIFLLGVLMRGARGLGASTALGLVLLLRILYHVYQGPLGVSSVLVFGLGFGLVWLRFERLWVLVFAHLLWDMVPLTLATS